MAKLDGKKILYVIAQKDFRDEEYLVPSKMFKDEGALVTVASDSKGECSGMLGAKVLSDCAISDCHALDYDVIVVAGGMGAIEYIWPNETLHALLKDFRTQSKGTHAICLSPAVLAITGILNGKKGTVYQTDLSRGHFEKGGAKLLDEPVVLDGGIVTGRDPDAAEPFGKKIIELLAG